MVTTVKQIEYELKKGVELVDNTVDTLKVGDSNQEVTKIAVCFMPTYEVIQKAINRDSDLLICHEGIFYSHSDKLISEESEIHQKKVKLIEDSGIAILRLHDYIHRYQTDGIMQGIMNLLEWNDFVKENRMASSIFELSERKLSDVIDHLKNKLKVNYVRYIGDLSQSIKTIAVLVGYRGGGDNAIPLFVDDDVDLVIYGGGPEWETPEYVRDANSIGKNKAVIILGHLESEEPGMFYLANVLKKKYPQISIEFLPSFSFIKVK